MPKLYEYFGLVVLFYANEHDPVHVHGKCEDRECRAEIVMLEGKVSDINFRDVAGRKPLDAREMQHFRELVTVRAEEIVNKWIDFFVLHKPVRPERINRRLK